MPTIIRPNIDVPESEGSSVGLKEGPASYADTTVLSPEEVSRPHTEPEEIASSGEWNPEIRPLQHLELVTSDYVAESQANERTFSGKRSLLLMVSGLIIGVIVTFLASYHRSNGVTADIATPAVATVTIAAKDEAITASESKALNTIQAPTQAPEPSGIVEYAKESPVALEKRQYLHTAADSGRAYSPVYVQPKKNDGFGQGEEEEAPRLRAVQGKTNRYRSTNSSMEWQGGWYARSPEKNLRIGKAYKEYLKNGYGNSSLDKLTSFEKGPSRLVGNLGRSVKSPAK